MELEHTLDSWSHSVKCSMILSNLFSETEPDAHASNTGSLDESELKNRANLQSNCRGIEMLCGSFGRRNFNKIDMVYRSRTDSDKRDNLRRSADSVIYKACQ